MVDLAAITSAYYGSSHRYIDVHDKITVMNEASLFGAKPNNLFGDPHFSVMKMCYFIIGKRSYTLHEDKWNKESLIVDDADPFVDEKRIVDPGTISLAYYGSLSRYIDVTAIIQRLDEKSLFGRTPSRIFGCDPHHGALKRCYFILAGCSYCIHEERWNREGLITGAASPFRAATAVLPFTQLLSMPDRVVIILLGEGLGNQLFQYAAALDYAKRTGRELLIYDKGSRHSIIDYLPLFFPGHQRVTEPDPKLVTHHDECAIEKYDGVVYRSIPEYSDHIVYISGFFQNVQYFPRVRPQLARMWGTVPDLDAFFVHIRLGDYLVCGICMDYTRYLRTAIPLFLKRAAGKSALTPSSTMYIIAQNPDDAKSIVSEEKWWNEWPEEHRVILPPTNEVDTFKLMTRCRVGGVCTNSTFSWWAAYLIASPQKTVIIPSPWITSGTDLEMPGAIKVAQGQLRGVAR